MFLTILAFVPVAIWWVLLFARGQFWRIQPHLAPRALPPTPDKSVVVVIPARNEAEHIALTVAALAPQAPVIVVDDSSTDRTAELARVHATVIAGKPLPPGWTGKLWALSQGVDVALQQKPDYLLLTDADITHGPDSVRELVAIAEAGNYDLTSFMVKLRCEAAAEKLLIPAFVFFFFLLYPPNWIRSRTHKIAGAAGGCVLIRPAALSRIGGLAAICGEVIDDCALARVVKQSGGTVWLGLTETRRSERNYASFAEIRRMISRTAFKQLDHSTALLLGTLAGLLLTYVLPIVLLPVRPIPAVLAWALMSLAYLPMVRFYRLSPAWALSLPAIAAFYGAATFESAVDYWRGRGGQWKGRAQDV